MLSCKVGWRSFLRSNKQFSYTSITDNSELTLLVWLRLHPVGQSTPSNRALNDKVIMQTWP